MLCHRALIASVLLLPVVSDGVAARGSSAQAAPATAPGAGATAAGPSAPAARIAYAEPGISPDGRELAFVSGGDIWTVAAAGGEARLLVSHAATESRPLYAPDGKSLAFSSTRTGNGDVYVLTLDTGELRRLTYDDGPELPVSWSPDGRWVYFQSASQDLGGMADILRIAVDGGTAMPVTNDAYFNEFFGAVSPDGQRLAFSARGIAANQWWRHGHSHLDEAELWIVPIEAEAATRTTAPPTATAGSKGAAGSNGARSAGSGSNRAGSNRAGSNGSGSNGTGSNGVGSNGAGGVAGAAYEQVTTRGAKALWPMWSADGRALYFVSDRTGQENIWRVPVGSVASGASGAATAAPAADRATAAIVARAATSGVRGAQDSQAQARAVTSFSDGRVLWPTISRDGRTIAFERDFAIWTLDTASGRTQALSIVRRGAPAGPGVEHQRQTTGFQHLALSPDGKKVAFSMRGELYAASAKEGGDATRVTTTPAIDISPAWTPDSRRLVYVADLGVTSELHLYDFGLGTAGTGISTDTTLTTGQRDYAPAVAPNGEQVAFLRAGHELCLVVLASKATRCLAKAALPATLDASHVIAWSPDSRWIAFMASGAKGFTNVQIVAAAGGEPKAVSFLANVSSDSIAWSPDGTFLLYNTAQRTEQGQVARVDLVLRTPKFREDQFRELFPAQPTTPDRPAPDQATQKPATPVTPPPATPPAPESQDTRSDARNDATAKSETKAEKDKPPAPKKPTEVVFEDIRQRLGYLPVGIDVNALTISPDGKTLLLNASSEGQQNLYTYSLDELARERPVARQLTSTAGGKSDAQFSPDSKEVYYLEEGRIQMVTIERREPRPLAVTAEIDVDFSSERRAIFTQAWSLLNEHFYDPAFHGISWTQARDRFAPYAAGASTPDELRRIGNLMIGELNASHLGMSAPPNPATTTGRLGLRFDRGEYVRSGRLAVADVLPLGPAAVTRAIAPGDVLVAVNGTAVTRTTNLDRLLEHTIGKRVALTIESKGQKKEVAVQPANLSTERGLLYRQWVEARRAYVAKASGGRLGYVHMPDMGAPALAQLYVDLDAENHAREGVVIDLRNNNGGFVNAYALDVFTRRPYLNMTLRGRPTAPARTMLGQRALEAPTILVTNQHSLSDAEDFTEGYRRLKLGKVVGEPTAGWIIYTWNARLFDGSVLRLPRMRITDTDGKNMELAPRPIDVAAVRQPGDVRAGRDTQLDVAVRELLAQIGSAGAARRATTLP